MDGAGPLKGTIRPDNFYGRSKRLAEEAATAMHDSGRLQVTILRPSAVYGERDLLFAPNLARVLRLPVVPVMGRGDNTVPVVYAGNVAAGVASALDGRESGNAFNLAVDYPLTQRELLEGLAEGAQSLPDARLLAGGSRTGWGPVGRRCPFHGTGAPRALEHG
jgi:nucleoside-diphosphate-sugar epimerase